MLRGLGFTAAAGTLLALSGLYNTHLLGWPAVWLYWLSLVGLGVWIGSAINTQLAPLIDDFILPVRWLIASAAVTAPMFGLVAAAQTLIGQPVPAAGFLDLALKVFIVTAALTGVRMLRAPQKAEQPPKTPAQETERHPPPQPPILQTPPAPPLAKRLPQKLKGAEIWALSAEDHYVRVHTAAGSDLVLMRLSDAIKDMADIEGAQIHRSWWVARAGIAGLRRRTEGGIVTLKDGSEAPVSRRRLSEIEALGWTADKDPA